MTSEQAVPDPIFQIGMGFMASKQLMAASTIGVFEQLADGPATAEQLAQRTGAAPRPTRIVADAMVALGFLEKDEGVYRNAPVAATFLSGATPADMRGLMGLLDIEYQQWTHYEQVVRTGDPDQAGGVRADAETYAAAMEAVSGGVAQALPAAYDFGQHQRLLDLGGGTGTNLTMTLLAHPHLQGTLFDLPETAALARKRLAEAPVADRIEVTEGDLFHDPLPPGHDVILMSNVVSNFPPEHVPTLLQRVRHAAADGTRLLLVEAWTNVERTEPVMATLLSGQLFLEGGGEVYSADDGRNWLQQTGWQVCEHTPVAGPFTAIVADAEA